MDPENLEYRILLLKLLGQRPQITSLVDTCYISTVVTAYRDAQAQDLPDDNSGELDISFVEAVLEILELHSSRVTTRGDEQTIEAITHAKSLGQASSERLVDFALAQLNTNINARDYDLAVLRYELAYLADPEPKYLLALAEMMAVGPESLTEKPRLVFQRAEAVLQALRHTGYHHEMDLLRVENFYSAEICLKEGDRLFKTGDIAGAAAKARRAIELFPRSARPYMLLWKCIDSGGDASNYADDLERALHSAGYLSPPWIIDGRARKGMLLLEQGQHDEGMKLLTWALRDQPNNQHWLAAKKSAEARQLGSEAALLDRLRRNH